MVNQKFCSACGQPFEPGDVFCQSCGAKREEEISVKTNKKGGLGKKGIAFMVVLIIAAGSITGFSLFGKPYSIEGVIHNTLALKSGKIEITYSMESGGYENEDNYEVEFLKNDKEKTFLIDTNYETIYTSIKDGKVRTVNRWGDEEYDFEDELGLNASKLEKDIIDYFAGAFKGQEPPKGSIENMEIKKEKGGTVITGDIGDEADLLKWIYDCFDKDELKDLILNNMKEDSDEKDFFETEWDSEVESMDDEMDDIESEIENYAVDSSFKILIDKKGILDSAEIILEVEEKDWDVEATITINIKVTKKNDIDAIKEPSFD